jgi:hypothetical protein
MSGETVRLPGPAMDQFIGSLATLVPTGPVVIGGLAVMCRIGGEHRPTLDVDGARERLRKPARLVDEAAGSES